MRQDELRRMSSITWRQMSAFASDSISRTRGFTSASLAMKIERRIASGSMYASTSSVMWRVMRSASLSPGSFAVEFVTIARKFCVRRLTSASTIASLFWK